MLTLTYQRANEVDCFFEEHYTPPKKKLLRLLCLKPLIIYAGLFLLTMCINDAVKAQDVCSDFLSSYCTWDLTAKITGLVVNHTSTTSQISYGISYPTCKDVVYQKDSMKCDTLYNGGNTCVSGQGSLQFYVYYPESLNGNSLANCKLPVIINFHGGSYFECSRSTHAGAQDICQRLAERGFVVVNAEYRRGVLLDPSFDPNGLQKITVQQVLAIYRANQDVRGCIRSVIKMQRLSNNGLFGTLFNIDTTKIFIAGQSAGAVMAMGAAYYERQGQIDSALSSGNSNLSTRLGRLDAPFYVGDTTINYKPLVKGVLSMWGGLPLHRSFYTDAAAYFSTNTVNPPLIGFTGLNDKTFPPGNNYFYFNTRTHGGVDFKTTSLCLITIGSFSNPDDEDEPTDPTVNADAVCVGIDTLHAIFKRIGKYSEVYMDCQMEHGLDDDCPTCTFQSEFGTDALDQTTVINYIASRAAIYFTAILNTSPLSQITRTRFIECENTRKYCSVSGATDTECTNSVGAEDDVVCPAP